MTNGRLTKSRLRAFARRVANTYGPTGRYPIETLKTLLNVVVIEQRGEPAICLDVGAGCGIPAGLLSIRWPRTRFMLLDLSIDMLRNAKTRLSTTSPGVATVVADATRLPIRTGSCDLVLCCCALHLFPEKPQFVQEAARVLNHQGSVACVFYDREDLRLQTVHQLFPELFDREGRNHPSTSELVAMLSAHDLAVRQVQRLNYEIVFASRRKYLAYVAERPYFGFVYYTKAEFALAYQTFRQRVLTELPEGRVVSSGALTVIVASAADHV